MPHTGPTNVVKHLRRAVAAGQDALLPDAQLLEQFTAGRQPAFEALVRRHGPMVLGVCRRVLGNAHEAEDAFQATFLVLARGAASVRKRDSLGSWLHGVAYRVAAKARGQEAARQRREARAEPRAGADPLSEITGRELLAVLDEELQRLPEQHRAPLVLCHLQGQPHDEAARSLGFSERTLKRRLEEGRERLRRRLERRGLGLPSALLLAGLTQGAAGAVPRALADAVTRAATGAAAGRAAGVGATVKAVAAVVILGGLTALGVGLSTHPAQAERQPDPPPAAKVDKGETKKAQEEMAVSGRVLAADGKPVAGARVGVVAWLHPRYRGPSDKAPPHTTTDRDGKFRLTAPRRPAAHLFMCRAVAAADGHGLAWADIDPEAARAEVTVRLRPERVVSGRVLTVEGAPAAGVTVRLDRMSTPENVFLWPSPVGMPVWPAAPRTDAEGRFTLRGAGAGVKLWCRIDDARFDHHCFEVAHDAANKEVAIVLNPARSFEGLITCEDTGQPVAGAAVTAWVQTARGDDAGSTEAKTGPDGRFRMPLHAGNTIRWAVWGPPDGPHLAVMKDFQWPRGALRHEVKLTLPRGAFIRGRVTEAGTGKPVADALVRYYAESQPPLRADVLRATSPQGGRTDAEGRFRLPIPPAPGALIAHAASADYLVTEVFLAPLTGKVSPKPDGFRFYPHALLHLDLKRGTEAKDLQLTLRRGVTVRGRVVTPDGKPVERGWLLAPSLMPFRSQGKGTIRGGRFELPGCDPERPQKVFLQDSENRHGAIVEISGKQAGADVTVTLRPCGSATTRYVSPAGKPLPSAKPMAFQLVLNDGAHPGPDAFGRGLPVSDTMAVASPAADKDGRVEFTGLIPGARYRIVGQFGGSYGSRREFVAESGKRLELPDTVLER